MEVIVLRQRIEVGQVQGEEVVRSHSPGGGHDGMKIEFGSDIGRNRQKRRTKFMDRVESQRRRILGHSWQA
jgi:hypothetical protein